jgi:hypothetical protein
MILLKNDFDEYHNFMTQYGMIMFKEYKRWLDRMKLPNKIPEDEEDFIKFKFRRQKKSVRTEGYTKVKYQFQYVKKYEKTETTKVIVNIRSGERITPNIHDQAKSNNSVVKIKYRDIHDLLNDEAATVEIQKNVLITDTAYDDVHSFRLEAIRYDFCTDPEIGVQVGDSFIEETKKLLSVGDMNNHDQPIKTDGIETITKSTDKSNAITKIKPETEEASIEISWSDLMGLTHKDNTTLNRGISQIVTSHNQIIIHDSNKDDSHECILEYDDFDFD